MTDSASFDQNLILDLVSPDTSDQTTVVDSASVDQSLISIWHHRVRMSRSLLKGLVSFDRSLVLDLAPSGSNGRITVSRISTLGFEGSGALEQNLIKRE
ncbi:hypothetical protein V6N12_049653 [Hibiscus sabdariffa]|uniref:Uncharacterized protein n=1 Tax=Hibiscus sabdariffa TaxID=183260 RepID=A0ABR2GAH4_9ROSI